MLMEGIRAQLVGCCCDAVLSSVRTSQIVGLAVALSSIMVHWPAGTIGAAAFGCALVTIAPLAARPPFDAPSFLRTYAGFSSQDLARVAGGTAVAKTISADSDEVAIAGAVFMAIPRAVYLEKFKDIAT